MIKKLICNSVTELKKLDELSCRMLLIGSLLLDIGVALAIILYIAADRSTGILQFSLRELAEGFAGSGSRAFCISSLGCFVSDMVFRIRK